MNKNKIVNFIFRFLIFSFTILFGRVLHLQIIKGNYYFRLAEMNRYHIITEHALRGKIYDSTGKVLATNEKFFSVFFYPFIDSNQGIPAELFHESGLTKIDTLKNISMEIHKKLISTQPGKMIRLVENIDRNSAFKLMEQRAVFPSLFVTYEKLRYYPMCDVASHVIGYIGEIDKDELEKLAESGYKLGDLIGKLGVEAKYDKYLRGIDGGWLIETDALGRHLRIIDRVEPKRGYDFYLTINSELQSHAEMLMKKTGKSGAIIVMEPRTGRVLVLVSYPTYDPNVFASGDRKLQAAYLTDEKLPLYNRCIQGYYPPASVFKLIVAIAGLNEGKINIDEKIYCGGEFWLGKKRFRCWKEEGHGWISFFDAIAKSCDVYFYTMGLRFGIDMLSKYASKFHFDKKSNIDLPSEKVGLVPSVSWKLKTVGEKWYDGDTVNVAIGQGYIHVTPISLALMTSIIANEGIGYRPYIVDKIVDENNKVVFQNKPQRICEVEINKDAWKKLKKSMMAVVDYGTGYSCHIKGEKIGGKTGTAQNPHGEDHALFVSFYPVDEPEHVVTIVVEHGGMGGAVAAPIAKSIYKKIIEIKERSYNKISQECLKN